MKLLINYNTLPTPIGDLWVGATEKGLFYVNFGALDTEALESFYGDKSGVTFLLGGGVADVAARQLNEYFAGVRQTFSVPFDLRGTSGFMKKVYKVTQKIPFGEVRSYGWIADQIHEPYSARAVGGAMGVNPVPIIIPCHRVIKSTGAFGNYAAGAVRKKVIIGWEAARREAADAA